MRPKINRILIPLIIFILLFLSDQTISIGQTPANNSFLPIISYNPTGWIGPYGGTIVAVAVDPTNPQVIFAGTFGSGVFKSTDGGSNWHSVNRGLTNLYIYSLAIDPVQPDTLYAGTYRSGMYKSEDGGSSWIWSNSGIQEDAIVYSIAIDSIVTSRLFATTRGASNGGSEPWNGVVYKSTDAGQTWTPSLWNVGGMKVQDWVYSLAVNPNAPNQVFAATHINGPFRSDQYGEPNTWNSIQNNVRDPSGRAIVISPQPEYSSTLYLGVWHFDSVYKTVNSGNLWNVSNGGIPNVMVYSIAVDPYSVNTVYMGTFSNGILETVDGGRTWQNVGLQADQIYSVVINPNLTNNLFAGTSGAGLYRSMDYGISWQHSDTGISNTNVTAAVLSQANSYTIYASVYGLGVYQSTNRGQTWDELNTGLGDKFVHDLVMDPDPAHPGWLFALTDSGGLYLNDLNTANGWVSVGGGLPLTQTPGPAFTADHPFATLDMQEAFASPQVTLSIDQATNVNLLKMEYAPSNPQIAYMGTHGWGVYRSSNGGLSWLATGLKEQTVVGLAVDPSNPDLIYAATDISGSIKISIDGGSNWNNIYLPVNYYLYSVVASPAESGVVYAGTSGGVYRYKSGSWSALGLSDQSITAVALDPVRPGVIYAGTTSGAFYSTDNGLSWNIVNEQLNGQTIQSISFDRSIPNVVYFSTKTRGIFLVAIR